MIENKITATITILVVVFNLLPAFFMREKIPDVLSPIGNPEP